MKTRANRVQVLKGLRNSMKPSLAISSAAKMLKRAVIFLICSVILSACSVKKHATTHSEQRSQATALRQQAQVVLSFDSLLQTLDFSADSVTLQFTPSVPDTARAGELPKANTPAVKITAHNPRVRATKQNVNLVLAQQVEQDSVARQTDANSHADVSKDTVGVARPLNGTLVVVLLAVLLIAAIVLLLYLHKRRII